MKNNNIKLLTIALILLTGSRLFAQDTSWTDSLERYLQTKHSDIGISLCVIETQEKFSINGKKHYPMQSTYKFPQALAILHLVDKKAFSIGQKVQVSKSELRLNTWSPLRDNYPEGNIDISIAELLEYSVSKSDNNACDILFNLLGGTTSTDEYVKKIGIKEMAIVSTETDMAKEWNLQYKNYSSPDAMTELLKGFYKNGYLSPTATDFLMTLMTESSNSANRIKALLPKNVKVAHKTGTSSTNSDGLRPALNDVGIITLPNGNHVVLSVFISNSRDTYEEGEKTIAEISKYVWDHYSE